MKIELHSDGGSSSTGGAASASIIKTPQEVLQIVSYIGDATNNQAEIIGGLQALAYIQSKFNADAEVFWYCDSEYTLNSATKFIHKWQKNGWKTANGGEVKNQELWKLYLEVSKGLSISPVHIKGHSGHTENEACDTANVWLRKKVDSTQKIEEGLMQLDFDSKSEWAVVSLKDWLGNLSKSSPVDAASELANKVTNFNTAVARVEKTDQVTQDANKFVSDIASIVDQAKNAGNYSKEKLAVINYLKEQLCLEIVKK